MADCVLSGPHRITSSSTGDAFGFFARENATTLHYIYIQGLNNALGNKMMVKTFNTDSRTWSSARQLYTDASYNIGGAKGGVIGSKIYIFTSRRTAGAADFIDIVKLETTDLTATAIDGVAESIYTFPDIARGNPDLGNLSSTGTSGEYVIPTYYHINQASGSWKIGLIKTTDSGASWTVDDDVAYSGDGLFGETALVNVGTDNLIIHVRDNNGGKISQATSSDGGLTWTNLDDGRTNIGVLTGVKIPHLYYDATSGELFEVYHDRGNSVTTVMHNPLSSVFSNPTGWGNSLEIDNSYFYYGYASMEKVSSNLYVIVYSKTHLYWVLYKVGVCADPALSVCGNSLVEEGEECDDGNTNSGDGCSAACLLEPPEVCGNGVLTASEECDDGNAMNGDGCSDTCRIEVNGYPVVVGDVNMDGVSIR